MSDKDDPDGNITICDSLAAFADGDMEPQEAAEFRLHLAHCEKCQKSFVFHGQLATRLAELEVVEPAEGREERVWQERVWQRIENESKN